MFYDTLIILAAIATIVGLIMSFRKSDNTPVKNNQPLNNSVYCQGENNTVNNVNIDITNTRNNENNKEETAKRKKNSSKYLYRGLILAGIFIPLFFVVFLKLIYSLKVMDNSILLNLSDLVVDIYDASGLIRFIWTHTPDPFFERLLTIGNVLSVVYFILALGGFFMITYAQAEFSKLKNAKRKAEAEKLKESYK